MKLFVLMVTLIYTMVNAKPISENSVRKPDDYWGGKDKDMCYFDGVHNRFYNGKSGHVICTVKVCPRDDLGSYPNSTCQICCYGKEQIKTKTIVIENKSDWIKIGPWLLVAVVVLFVLLVVMAAIFGRFVYYYIRPKTATMETGSPEFSELLLQKKRKTEFKNKDQGNEDEKLLVEKEDEENQVEKQIIAQDSAGTSTNISQDDNNIQSADDDTVVLNQPSLHAENNRITQQEGSTLSLNNITYTM